MSKEKFNEFHSLSEAEKYLIQIYNIESTSSSTRNKILNLLSDLHQQMDNIIQLLKTDKMAVSDVKTDAES